MPSTYSFGIKCMSHGKLCISCELVLLVSLCLPCAMCHVASEKYGKVAERAMCGRSVEREVDDWRLLKVAVGQAKAGNEVLMSYVDWRVTSNVIGCSRRRRGGGYTRCLRTWLICHEQLWAAAKGGNVQPLSGCYEILKTLKCCLLLWQGNLQCGGMQRNDAKLKRKHLFMRSSWNVKRN